MHSAFLLRQPTTLRKICHTASCHSPELRWSRLEGFLRPRLTAAHADVVSARAPSALHSKSLNHRSATVAPPSDLRAARSAQGSRGRDMHGARHGQTDRTQSLWASTCPRACFGLLLRR